MYSDSESQQARDAMVEEGAKKYFSGRSFEDRLHPAARRAQTDIDIGVSEDDKEKSNNNGSNSNTQAEATSQDDTVVDGAGGGGSGDDNDSTQDDDDDATVVLSSRTPSQSPPKKNTNAYDVRGDTASEYIRRSSGEDDDDESAPDVISGYSKSKEEQEQQQRRRQRSDSDTEDILPLGQLDYERFFVTDKESIMRDMRKTSDEWHISAYATFRDKMMAMVLDDTRNTVSAGPLRGLVAGLQGFFIPQAYVVSAPTRLFAIEYILGLMYTHARQTKLGIESDRLVSSNTFGPDDLVTQPVTWLIQIQGQVQDVVMRVMHGAACTNVSSMGTGPITDIATILLIRGRYGILDGVPLEEVYLRIFRSTCDIFNGIDADSAVPFGDLEFSEGIGMVINEDEKSSSFSVKLNTPINDISPLPLCWPFPNASVYEAYTKLVKEFPYSLGDVRKMDEVYMMYLETNGQDDVPAEEDEQNQLDPRQQGQVLLNRYQPVYNKNKDNIILTDGDDDDHGDDDD